MMDYYLGKLGLENSSEQAKMLRKIVLSDKAEPEKIKEFREFVLSQNELFPDTVSIINKSLMAGYGSEYLGLCGDDYSQKLSLYKQFIGKFPDIFSLKFYYAECGLLAGLSVEEIYPALKEGMLRDKKNIHYPSAEMFELIHESTFSFDFDMMLLDKYYQPCDKETFDDWILEFKEQYTDNEEQDFLTGLKWKGCALQQ